MRAAAALDALGRNVELGLGVDEDRPVEDAVLLGPDERLGLVQERELSVGFASSSVSTAPASSISDTVRPSETASSRPT